MICADCNGKGYVIENHRESVCNECGGHGEFYLIDRNKNYKQEAQQVHDAPCFFSGSITNEEQHRSANLTKK